MPSTPYDNTDVDEGRGRVFGIRRSYVFMALSAVAFTVGASLSMAHGGSSTAAVDLAVASETQPEVNSGPTHGRATYVSED